MSVSWWLLGGDSQVGQLGAMALLLGRAARLAPRARRMAAGRAAGRTEAVSLENSTNQSWGGNLRGLG